MRYVVVFCCGLTIWAARCHESAGQAPVASPQVAAQQVASPTSPRGDFVVGKAIRCENLTVFPILSRVPRNEDPFITLDEALRTKTVEVSEIGATSSRAGAGNRSQRPGSSMSQRSSQAVGSVNRVSVINRSDRPLYLMPGEIIMGGKQDRAIANEMIVESSGRPVEVEVYCVEHGRWSGREGTEGLAMLQSVAESSGQRIDRQAAERLSREARGGKFVASAGSLNSSARRVVQEGKGQTHVWNEVGATNRKSNVSTATDAFTANYADEGLRKHLKDYLDRLQSPVAEQPQAVGVIVAINGKVTAADVFQSTPLFLRLWPKLLKSYALDAATTSRQAKADRTCSQSDACAFLEKAMQADVKKEDDGHGGLVVSHRETRDVVSFSAKAKRANAMPAEASKSLGGFGGSVHASAYAK